MFSYAVRASYYTERSVFSTAGINNLNNMDTMSKEAGFHIRSWLNERNMLLYQRSPQYLFVFAAMPAVSERGAI